MKLFCVPGPGGGRGGEQARGAEDPGGGLAAEDDGGDQDERLVLALPHRLHHHRHHHREVHRRTGTQRFQRDVNLLNTLQGDHSVSFMCTVLPDCSALSAKFAAAPNRMGQIVEQQNHNQQILQIVADHRGHPVNQPSTCV